jgi:hypothetical protein
MMHARKNAKRTSKKKQPPAKQQQVRLPCLQASLQLAACSQEVVQQSTVIIRINKSECSKYLMFELSALIDLMLCSSLVAGFFLLLLLVG